MANEAAGGGIMGDGCGYSCWTGATWPTPAADSPLASVLDTGRDMVTCLVTASCGASQSTFSGSAPGATAQSSRLEAASASSTGCWPMAWAACPAPPAWPTVMPSSGVTAMASRYGPITTVSPSFRATWRPLPTGRPLTRLGLLPMSARQ